MIKFKFFILSLLLSIPFLYINCSGPDDNLGLIKIPNAISECLSIAATQCQLINNNKVSFIGITDDISLNCASHIGATHISQLNQIFLASGTSVTQHNATPSMLTSTHSLWHASTNLQVDVLENKEYLFCGFIDINNDSFYNTGEPILSQQGLLSDLESLKLDNWNDN